MQTVKFQTLNIKFEVPGLPPSYNQAFQINHFRRSCYLSPEARLYKKKVFMAVPKTTIPEGQHSYYISIEYWHNWICKNGNIKRSDIQNRDKLVIDSIFERLGIDDSCVWENVNKKKPDINVLYDGEDKIVVELSIVDKKDEADGKRDRERDRERDRTKTTTKDK